MEWLAVQVVVMLLAVPLMIRAERVAREKQLRGWRSVAKRLGLKEVESSYPPFGSPRLRGKAGGRRVELSREQPMKGVIFTRLSVEGNSGLTLLNQGATGAGPNRWGEREVELGDEAFDAKVEIHGAADRARALLDVDTRRVVLQMLGGRLEMPGRPAVTIAGTVSLCDGDLRAMLPERPRPPAPEDVHEALEALLDLVERFERPANVAQRLASTLEREPQWRARLEGVVLLSTSYPTDPATLGALRHALADEVPAVRLQAAIGLGDEGLPALREIAAAEGIGDATAAHAIDVLGDRLPAEACEAALRQALRRRRLQTADACIKALARVGGASGARLLAKVMLLEGGPLAIAAAQALGKSGDGEAEGALLEALGRGGDLTVPVIEALGRVGTVRAVLPIKEAAGQDTADLELRRAVRQAVAEIQSRLPGASPGQVSIAEGEGGQLSLADDDPRGQVSLPEAG